MISRLPSTGRPIAWSGKARSWKWSKMMSSGVSLAWPISCRITLRSRSSSSGVEGRVHAGCRRGCRAPSADVLLQHLGVIGGALARGVGVEVAADRLDLLGDGAGAAPLGALERHVLEEMRDAVDLGRLVAGADIDPEAERDRLDRVIAVGDDAQAVGEGGEPGRSCRPRLGGRARRAWARTKACDGGEIVRQDGDPLAPFHEVGERGRQRRADAGGALDRVGEFGRMRAWPAPPSARRCRSLATPPGRRRCRRRYADRSACRVRR